MLQRDEWANLSWAFQLTEFIFFYHSAAVPLALAGPRKVSEATI